jgi:hypothetical protein
LELVFLPDLLDPILFLELKRHLEVLPLLIGHKLSVNLFLRAFLGHLLETDTICQLVVHPIELRGTHDVFHSLLV